ncbi:putative bifunctional diguanylate cyclase/phosphodiesterase [Mycolicibacterium sediminis]|uniref:GGDEF-domain containing protein n=1 Tax=Mycolicibacterium sediminis TaxID=1286180 RepID=A0A7I7QNN6_9MYCO|nr:bifunctional diguanylate cyclase/phosphodiesterase [Mycolicibacterium sediminis]BBY27597.1 hypothetical protein MSEDJ_16930 [Mycolicibacterium sediminis]
MGSRPGEWAALTRGDMWPGVATPTLMTRTGGSCFLLGGLLVAVTTTVSPTSFGTPTVQFANAAIAVIVGTATLLWGARLRLWQLHVLVATATVQTTVSVYESADPTVAVSFATLYVFIACAAFFVSWRATAAHLTLAVACCCTAVVLSPAAPWWSSVVASATTVTMGVLIAILGRIVYNAELDDDTGLLNRRGFDRLLGVVISRAQSGGPRPAVVLLTLDDYGIIHDDLGGPRGDEVLHHVVAAWRGVLEPEQILARRAADEFGVLLQNSYERQAVSLTHRLREAITSECSAGVTAWQSGETASAVLARADTALRRSRRSGRNRTMLESALLPSIATELREAIDAGTVNVRYQPIISLADGSVVAVEALLRWQPVSRPDLSPTEVVRLAEENDLIGALDHYVLRRACRDACWMHERSGGAAISLSVNVSGLDLVQKGYAAQVFDTLGETGWSAERLVLEVTETVVDGDRPSSIAALSELRAGGVRIAIDDFGTGYSSLGRLQGLPSDFLKLDASFVAAVTEAGDPPPLLTAVAALAHALHLPVVAEGVETPRQRSALVRLGIDMAQGFYFGRPQAPGDLVEVFFPAASAAATDSAAHPRR